jgi:hypothetical protein
LRTGDATAARELATRVHLLSNDDAGESIPALVADALSSGHVLRIGYRDREGDPTARGIEPLRCGRLGR